MQVISLCSQKGGSGKTTLTGHLAVQAARLGGGPVALIDCDPQGSLAAWWNSRESAQPAFVADLARDPGRRPAAPARARLSLRVHRHAARRQHADPARDGAERSGGDPDPAQPARSAGGPRDARHRRACGQAGDLRRQRRRGTGADHLRCRRGPVAAWDRGAGFVCHRIVMASSMIDGRTVMETDPEHRATGEIVALWGYLEERLLRLANRHGLPQPAPRARSFGRRSDEEAAVPASQLAAGARHERRAADREPAGTQGHRLPAGRRLCQSAPRSADRPPRGPATTGTAARREHPLPGRRRLSMSACASWPRVRAGPCGHCWRRRSRIISRRTAATAPVSDRARAAPAPSICAAAGTRAERRRATGARTADSHR